MNIIEKILVFMSAILLYFVKIAGWISQIIEFLVAVALIFGIFILIKEYGQPISMVILIFSLAFIFISFIILAIWKPKRLDKLKDKILK
jgi:energy-coupling factor transporter transmembrane protein EcfT